MVWRAEKRYVSVALQSKGLVLIEQIAEKAISNIHFVQGLSGKAKDLVVGSYVSGFQNTFYMNLAFAGVCLVVSIVMRQSRLD